MHLIAYLVLGFFAATVVLMAFAAVDAVLGDTYDYPDD